MFFCPECNFLLDITKNLNDTIRTKMKDVNDPKTFIDLVSSNNDKLINNVDFLKSELSKYITSNKIKDENKIMKKFDFFEKKKNKNFLVCNNCWYYEFIKDRTIIYKNISSIQKEYTEDKLSYMIKDNTLPRTKDYICANKECESHKNDVDKEGIFYRVSTESYKINYLCTNCKTSWGI